MNNKIYWFAPKRYGVGIRPATLIGWLVLCVFTILLLVGIYLFTSGLNIALGVVLVILDIIAFSLIVKNTTGPKT